jgi:hypothetical protein
MILALVSDLDSTVVTVFGNQEDAAVGYNPRYRGKKSYDPLVCMEANSSFLWDAANVPLQIRESRVRADAGSASTPCSPLWKLGAHNLR